MFKLENVRFKDILNIDKLIIEAGQITGIVGKSGGGKTTFLKLLNNMISPDQGTIKFKSKDIMEYDPIELRRQVVMLPQNPVVFGETIEDNFKLTLEYADKSSSLDFEQVLEQVKLDHDLDTKGDNLSGGEKQRLALARVMLLEPKILLLDEPSSALDQETEQFIIEMVVDYIKRVNGTLVMITHSKTIADQYSDKLITINQGQIDSVEVKEDK